MGCTNAQVRVGETVIVRPGEYIPVDGEVLAAQATINQAAITGESMPIEASQGTKVFAATIATGGSLRLMATAIGADTTFGKVIRMVEAAELHARGQNRRGESAPGAGPHRGDGGRWRERCASAGPGKRRHRNGRSGQRHRAGSGARRVDARRLNARS